MFASLLRSKAACRLQNHPGNLATTAPPLVPAVAAVVVPALVVPDVTTGVATIPPVVSGMMAFESDGSTSPPPVPVSAAIVWFARCVKVVFRDHCIAEGQRLCSQGACGGAEDGISAK